MPYFVYILRCADDSFYVGHCTDLPNRVREHNAGQGAKHTSVRLPVALVYSEEHATQTEAVQRERQIKRWSREKKTALIRGDLAALKSAARSRR